MLRCEAFVVCGDARVWRGQPGQGKVLSGPASPQAAAQRRERSARALRPAARRNDRSGSVRSLTMRTFPSHDFRLDDVPLAPAPSPWATARGRRQVTPQHLGECGPEAHGIGIVERRLGHWPSKLLWPIIRNQCHGCILLFCESCVTQDSWTRSALGRRTRAGDE